MTSAYRDRLERELARIRSVADDFEAALRVEALLNGTGESPSKVLELKADDPKKTSGKITIRKIAADEPVPVEKPGKPKRVRQSADHQLWRGRVMDYIRAHGTAKSGELLEHFGIANGSKAEKQVLYQVMYDLRRLKQLARGDDLVYRLP
jgi:hypothetical protein